ncbi:MAG: hypothetical protein M1469_05250 [Bacteroidetes bacterium]|nr:hypothetical protein [Bacteroidota bacterium]
MLVLLWVVLAPRQNPKSAIRNTKSPLLIAYIDASHLNRFSEYGDDGVWPLTNNLVRNGYLPIVCRKFSPALLETSKIAFFIVPDQELSGAEMNELEGYMKHG